MGGKQLAAAFEYLKKDNIATARLEREKSELLALSKSLDPAPDNITNNRFFNSPDGARHIAISVKSSKTEYSIVSGKPRKPEDIPSINMKGTGILVRGAMGVDRTMFQSSYKLAPKWSTKFELDQAFETYGKGSQPSNTTFLGVISYATVNSTMDDLLSDVEKKAKMKQGNRSTFVAFERPNGVQFVMATSVRDNKTHEGVWFGLIREQEPSPS